MAAIALVTFVVVGVAFYVRRHMRVSHLREARATIFGPENSAPTAELQSNLLFSEPTGEPLPPADRGLEPTSPLGPLVMECGGNEPATSPSASRERRGAGERADVSLLSAASFSNSAVATREEL